MILLTLISLPQSNSLNFPLREITQQSLKKIIKNNKKLTRKYIEKEEQKIKHFKLIKVTSLYVGGAEEAEAGSQSSGNQEQCKSCAGPDEGVEIRGVVKYRNKLSNVDHAESFEPRTKPGLEAAAQVCAGGGVKGAVR